MSYSLGLIHRPTPSHVMGLARVAPLVSYTMPASVDWHAKCPADGDALGNDVISNCVPVAMLRAIQMRRANAWGDTWVPQRAQADTLYTELSGWDPATGQPDIGVQTDTAMAHWTSAGIRTGEQAEDVPHWVTVPPRALMLIRMAIATFGPVQLSCMLPDALKADPLKPWTLPTGKTTGDWTAGSWGGHRVFCGKYDRDSLTVRSWGTDIPVDTGFLLQYCVGVDATVSRQWLDTTGLSPTGFNWDAMMAEADSLRSA